MKNRGQLHHHKLLIPLLNILIRDGHVARWLHIHMIFTVFDHFGKSFAGNIEQRYMDIYNLLDIMDGFKSVKFFISITDY